MKSPKALILFLLFPFANIIANAQISQIQHVIIVIQENRTPDNLFATNSSPKFASGADIVDITKTVPCEIPADPIRLIGESLDACFDPNHGHEEGWLGNYDGGLMDGACENAVTVPTGCSPGTAYPADTYVNNSGSPHGILQPYFDIANTYAFANYMFQTNQGPSFPAHQFLFGGTSAPTSYSSQNTLYEWFAGENSTAGEYGANTSYAGCAAPTSPNSTVVLDVNPNPPPPENWEYTPSGYPQGFPCYTHNTLATLLDNAGKSWSYYAPPGAGATQGNTLWTAPNAISSICLPLTTNSQGTFCNGTEWNSHVKLPPTSLVDYAPILTDISTCSLQANVAFVIPDGAWSDHPSIAQGGVADGGPSWVAQIVDAVGAKSGTNDCTNGSANWENTVILITWDDWGGWYDHVSPATSKGGPGSSGYPNSGNPPNGQYYVYGFRVPLLVVSAYGTSAGYISGNKNLPGGGEKAPYIHDFGSLLGFIEQVFNLNTANYPSGIGDPHFPYADWFAPDGHNAGCSQTTCPYPLWDFFNFNNAPSTFVPIISWKYPANCFHTPATASCFGTTYQPSDPDDDGIHQQD